MFARISPRLKPKMTMGNTFVGCVFLSAIAVLMAHAQTTTQREKQNAKTHCRGRGRSRFRRHVRRGTGAVIFPQKSGQG